MPPLPQYLLLFLTLILALARLALTKGGPDVPLLIGTYKNGAGILNMSSSEVMTVFKVADDPYARHVTYDLKNKKVYWTGVKFGGVYWANFDGSSIQTFYNASGTYPWLIAYDWIGGNLYITDFWAEELLTVCKGSDPSKCASMSIPGIYHAEALTLNPLDGVLYWSVSLGYLEDKIYRADMDGSNNATVIRENVGGSFGLVYDLASNRLFWTTYINNASVESSGPNGEDHRVLNVAPSGPGQIYFGIAVYNDTVFWSDIHEQTIWSVHKSAIEAQRTEVYVLGNKEDYIYSLAVLDPSNQPAKRTSPCANSPCSHVCVLKRHSSFRCLCPGGMNLAEDERTCFVV